MREFLPIARWLPAYRRADLRYDVIAGVTVSALVVPKALGYAEIAQVPVENGLYAAAAGALIYAAFGTSRQISTGPSSALAAIAASAVVITGVASGAADGAARRGDHRWRPGCSSCSPRSCGWGGCRGCCRSR